MSRCFEYFNVAPSACCWAIKQQRLALKKPEIGVNDFLAILQKQQLPQTVSILKEFLEFL